jgi:hypothetical protein
VGALFITTNFQLIAYGLVVDVGIG